MSIRATQHLIWKGCPPPKEPDQDTSLPDLLYFKYGHDHCTGEAEPGWRFPGVVRLRGWRWFITILGEPNIRKPYHQPFPVEFAEINQSPPGGVVYGAMYRLTPQQDMALYQAYRVDGVRKRVRTRVKVDVVQAFGKIHYSQFRDVITYFDARHTLEDKFQTSSPPVRLRTLTFFNSLGNPNPESGIPAWYVAWCIGISKPPEVMCEKEGLEWEEVLEWPYKTVCVPDKQPGNMAATIPEDNLGSISMADCTQDGNKLLRRIVTNAPANKGVVEAAKPRTSLDAWRISNCPQRLLELPQDVRLKIGKEVRADK